MKLNWAERWVVNNPSRVLQQRFELLWMRRALALPPGARVLEVGCGRGAGAQLIAGAFRPGALHAMDLDLEMIRKASRRLTGRRDPVSLYVADLTRLPHQEGSLDAVFGFGVLHHVPDWGSALVEVSRVLKPGGVYFLEELFPSLYQNALTRHILLHPRENRFRSRELRAALDEARFQTGAVLEVPKVGILGVFRKGGPGPGPSPS